MSEQVFVFTAGNPEARAHLSDSIINPIDPSKVLAFFRESEKARVQQIASSHGLYAWGAIPGIQNTPRWKKMRPGDWVLCVYDNRYHYAAQVVQPFDNKDFAESVWGKTPEGATWSHIYFLTPPKVVDVAIADVAEYLNERYMGFFQISEDKLAQIKKEFGSTENFIQSKFLNATETLPADPVEALKRENVLKAIADFNNGINPGFGDSTDYDLIHENSPYPPKAIYGMAAKEIIGRYLRPDEFSSGEGSKCFRTLRKLGFSIQAKTHDVYVLLRSNESSPWNDELGAQYHYSRNVPNYTRLLAGAKVVVDRKAKGGARLIGYGELGPALENGNNEKGVQEYLSPFKTWTEISPHRDIPSETVDAIRALPTYNSQYSIQIINKDIYEALLGEKGEEVPQPEIKRYSIDDALKELFLDRAELEAILAGLSRKKNVLLEGPPGVGKTFAARRIAEVFIGLQDSGRVEQIQFHQSYSYEDFIQGWRPNGSGGFFLKNGVFYEFCKRAQQDLGNKYVFIIDEINRGNLSKIFGELMMLIESDKRGEKYKISLTYSDSNKLEDRFYVPANLYVIGLMNTADRSLAMVDYALRRRFSFYPLTPKFDSPTFKAHLINQGVSSGLVETIRSRLTRLNAEISKNSHLGDGFLIGHSHFCQFDGVAPNEDWYKSVIEYDIRPLVKEYWFDQKAVADDLVDELLP